SYLRQVAAQPCRRGAADTATPSSSTVWARSPTRVVPGVERRQPHLRQTAYPFSAHACRSPRAAWPPPPHRGMSKPTPFHERCDSGTPPPVPAHIGAARPLHDTSGNAAQATDSDPYLSGVEGEPTRLSGSGLAAPLWHRH